MAAERAIAIEVVYARAEAQEVVELTVRSGTTAAQAVRLSGLLERHPEIDLTTSPLGIHGRVRAGDTELIHGDRVEIYRPLIADPKQNRRRLASRR